MPNRLIDEPSLYLQQHAHNPVEWWPWGEEAFAEAQQRDVPVLVSIGYSACHWCHVMEHESFENDYIAKLMNEHFVCIKVDREERPDVDGLYMEAVMMLNGHGGWPLNVFCLPDKRPFFGGTYFPPEDTGRGIIPWPQLLMRISEHWQRDRGDLLENADAIIKNIAHGNTPPGAGEGDSWNPVQLVNAADLIQQNHDDEWGGFGQAPKFPQPMTLRFLLTLRGSEAAERRPQLRQRIDWVVNRTLTAMARGGLFDQFGGGFARYSVDRQWVIPHFEKMLYDNGQLLGLYATAGQAYQEPLYADVAAETVAWLEREMRLDSGLYAASLDADSPGGEGRFYCWTPAEVHEVLPDDEAQRICKAYAITEEGNFEHGWTNPVLALGNHQARQELAGARGKLLEAREHRGRPGRDEKALLAWNALALRGLADAAIALDREDWLHRADALAGALEARFRRPDGAWGSVVYGEQLRGLACLDDVAFFAEAVLALSAAGDRLPAQRVTHLEALGAELAAFAQAQFRDAHQAGYFQAAEAQTDLAVRKKDWLDNAIPAGISALIHAFGALYALTGESKFAREIAELRPAYTGLSERAPTAIAHALDGITRDAMGGPVVKGGDASLAALAKDLRGRFPRQTFLRAEDRPGVQLCIGVQCLAATEDLGETAELISGEAIPLSSL